MKRACTQPVTHERSAAIMAAFKATCGDRENSSSERRGGPRNETEGQLTTGTQPSAATSTATQFSFHSGVKVAKIA